MLFWGRAVRPSMGLEPSGRESLSAAPGSAASSNPFAAPVPEKREYAASWAKPLSLWIVQLVLALQALLGAIQVGMMARQGLASPLRLYGMSCVVLALLVIIIGIQRARRWAQVAMVAALACTTVAVVLAHLLSSPDGRWAQQLLRLRLPSRQEGFPLGSLALAGSLSLWAGFGRRSREYFRGG